MDVIAKAIDDPEEAAKNCGQEQADGQVVSP